MREINTTTYATVLTRGTKASFSSLPAADGKIRFVVDSRELYIDYGNEHIKVSDIIDTYTEVEMRELPLDKIITNKIYLTSDTKKMFMYVGTDWLNLIENHTHVVAQIVDAGSAARFNVPETGNAGAGQVVLGSDTRLSDARIASDVYPWAKQEFKPSYNVTEIINTGTAAEKDVPISGDASVDQVVLGSDSRLTDARIAADVYDWAKQPTKPTYTKSEVGLSNVDNTSDSTKKDSFTGTISSDSTGFVVGSSIYNALAEKLNLAEKGEPNGVAELDEHGHVLASQLPGSVDEIKEGYYDKTTGKFYKDAAHTIEIPGESDKIYLDV